jgi:prepilin-type processing-associated H-X9-DG protein
MSYDRWLQNKAIHGLAGHAADHEAMIAAGMLSLSVVPSLNHIGTPGQRGFGVGICPAVPTGFTPLFGYNDPAHDNYGNYLYSDGSVMVWIPAFWYRIGHTSNQTYAGYGVNSVDVLPYSAFADVAAANAAGYAHHRAFYDGGAVQSGFFVDKYQASNNGGIASSIRNGNPLSTNSAHNPIGSLTGLSSADNIYAGCFAAAKTRGARFHPTMRYQYAALALLSLAHAQATTSSAWCAWYDATGTNNFPKGNNNNALADSNDATVKFTSDGYLNCAKTGSATNIAKTTHNGQPSGVADLNGNMWEVSPGITCISGTKTITAALNSNPVRLTVVGHGLATGATVMIQSCAGMTQINDKLFAVTVIDANTVDLQSTDGTAFGVYAGSGVLTYGTFYALNTSYAAKNLTGGNTLATDQFGATGVAAHSLAFLPTFRTDYANNGFSLRFGNTTNQVLDAAVSGAGWLATGLGIPLANGASAAGSNAFGADYQYQYLRNELCLISGAGWLYGSNAGVWAAIWDNARTSSSNNVGFRAASYL